MFPSESIIHANLPFSSDAGPLTTFTPPARSCASISTRLGCGNEAAVQPAPIPLQLRLVLGLRRRPATPDTLQAVFGNNGTLVVNRDGSKVNPGTYDDAGLRKYNSGYTLPND